jgi:Fic family protein
MLRLMTTMVSDKAKDSRREFLDSHRWITFRLDISHVSPWFFENVGEARSKCKHLAMAPMPPRTADEMHRLFLAKGAHATTAIEGNTLSEEQVERVIAGELELPPSQEYLQREIENIVDACEAIESMTQDSGRFEISVDLLCTLNRKVLEGLDREEWVQPGRFRQRAVGVGAYLGAPHDDVEFLTEMMAAWLNGPDFEAVPDDKRSGFLRTLLRAVMAHLYIAWIHPFGDGNGRVARLVEFGILTAAGIPSVAAHLLSNHYNQTRAAYYRHLDAASRSGGDVRSFLTYAAQGFVDQLEEQLGMVRGQYFTNAWTVYVHEHFHHQHGQTAKRQRDLVLALPIERVPRNKLRHLSPALAEAYAGKGAKTISRDINALERLGLIERSREGIRARREVMLGFLPSMAGDGQSLL